MLADIPDEIDPNADWQLDYWSGELGVSKRRVAQAVGQVGSRASRVRSLLREGYRVTLRDSGDGVDRLVARITLENNGFAVSVPYHPSREGWLFEYPVDYSKQRDEIDMAKGKHYKVNDLAKLSIHLDGFVQFSSAGGRPIISGFNDQLQQAKGIGMHAATAVNVVTGPLFGIIVQG